MYRGIVANLIAILVIAGVIVSCSTLPSGQDPGIAVTLDVPLQAASGLEQLVEAVTLRIYAEDMETMSFDMPVVKGRVSKTIEVLPGPDRIFEMSATDAEGRVLYFGADTVSIGQALDVAVNISLMPVILLMRVSPRYQEVNVETSCTIDIHIFNVDSLYGAAFKLLYNPNEIRIDDCEEGGFLGTGDGVLFEKFLETGSPVDPNVDSAAISYTRTKDVYEYGVSGSGCLATIHMTPLVLGPSEIRLTIHSEQALIKRQNGRFVPVDRIEELYLDGAVIVGRGVE